MSKNSLLDQYYTKNNVSEECCKILKKYFPDFSNYIFLEPSAGEGSFIDAINNVFGNVKILAYDIDPKRKDIQKADFSKLDLKEKHLITVGNPPFGKRASLAAEFFNIASKNSDIVAFIVPLQFEKYSIQKKLNKDYKLIYSKRLDSNSFIYNNKEYDVRCAFQIWTCLDTKYKDLRIKSPPPISHPDFEMFLYNNTEQARKYFDKKKYKWDFAVPRQGFYDYSTRITNEKGLNPKIQYMFFKADNPEVLKKLWNMDYEKLSLNNTSTPGFGKADIVEEYIKKI